jgi:hypothetical protein
VGKEAAVDDELGPGGEAGVAGLQDPKHASTSSGTSGSTRWPTRNGCWTPSKSQADRGCRPALERLMPGTTWATGFNVRLPFLEVESPASALALAASGIGNTVISLPLAQ